MGKQAPAPPNYQGAARKQAAEGQANVNAQTTANRPNQATPFGFSNWSQGPDGQWTQTSGLSGPLAGAMNQAPMDWSQFGKLDDGSAVREQTIDRLYNDATKRLNPEFDRREDQMHTQLANAGLDPTSAAARGAGSEFNTARNDAYGSAMADAIRGGNEAQSLTFNQNMAARNQNIMEALRARGLPAEEMSRLLPFLQQSGFMGAGMADPTQWLSAAGMQGNAELQKWLAENQANADLYKGGFEALQGGASFLPLFML